jgi:anti-sigma regulatory factor (Ser/Thr protein kinase)
MSDITITLPAVPDSIPIARHTLDRLADAIEPPLLDNIRLLVSEVVTNSIRHGHSEGIVDLRVDVNRRRVRVEVEDHGPGFAPSVGVADLPERSSGWGLLLVDRLAHRWGVVTSRTTTVWFEIDRAAGRP